MGLISTTVVMVLSADEQSTTIECGSRVRGWVRAEYTPVSDRSGGAARECKRWEV